MCIRDRCPGGGYEGQTLVFFTCELDVIEFTPNSKIMELASVLSMSLSNPDVKHLICAVSSEWTEVAARNQIHNSIRVVHDGSWRAAEEKSPYNLSQDLDAETLEKIIAYRKSVGITPQDAGPDDISIIPLRNRSNNPDLTMEDREFTEYERQYVDVTDEGSLFDLELFVSTYTGVDEKKQQHTIFFTALRMTGIPFVCPMTALTQL